ncbi:MAG: glycerol-3-phosphate 1-O-acyltransferase PlsY [Clostridia bacterium]|nr:glycerol-3-phosphate 1-O-acyltransferase PlsY [Clostridia bacterium]MBQ8862263.1 glycerol-3-phosphate 1-O-acyltransferase PlsY [Clostridia bacterium]
MFEIIRNGIIGYDSHIALFILGILLCVAVPYLLGSLNFAVIVSRKRYHDDVRTHGSGNAGATNMLRTHGKSAALLTLLGDLLKAVVSVVFALFLMPGDGFAYIAGLCCMLGHAFPIYYNFKGGKGVVVAAGTMLVLNPAVFLICIIIWILIILCTKYVSLAAIVAAVLFPLLNFFLYVKDYFMTADYVVPYSFLLKSIFSVIMGILIVWLHRENIVRLVKGTENKIGQRKNKLK